MFSKAACFSAYLNFVDLIMQKNNEVMICPMKNIRLYIDNLKGVDLDAQLQLKVDEMISALKEKNTKRGKIYLFLLDKTVSHNEAAWAKTYVAPLKIFFGY